MDPVKLPPGYLLPEGMTMKDVLRIDAELLASEASIPSGRASGRRRTTPTQIPRLSNSPLD